MTDAKGQMKLDMLITRYFTAVDSEYSPFHPKYQDTVQVHKYFSTFTLFRSNFSAIRLRHDNYTPYISSSDPTCSD